MRLKTTLITKTPIKILCKSDYEKVVQLDVRYKKLLEEFPDKSYYQIRKEIKPYVFTTIELNQTSFVFTTIELNQTSFVVLAKNKKEAWHQLSKETRKSVMLIQVETENGLKTLKKP